MQLERMEKRELLANDLAAISGLTFDDQNGDGIRDVSEPVIPNVTVSLYRETNVNGQFDDATQPPAQQDVLAGTLISDGNGLFRFTGIDGPDNDNPGDADPNKNPDGNGSYWLVQSNVPGRLTPDPVLVNITDDSGVTQVLIDDYSAVDGDGQSVSGLTGVFPESSVVPTGVVGGERDIQLTIVSNTDSDPNTGTVGLGVSTVNSRLSLSTPPSAVAQVLIQYDGLDSDGAGLTLQATGLGNVDLDGGDTQAGFQLMIFSDLPLTDGLQVRVYTDATNFSVTDIDLPGGSVDTEIFVPFSQFVQGAGAAGPANFSDVGAIEAAVDPTIVNPDLAGIDFQASILESIRSNETTVNIANITPVTLGGTLFVDNSVGGQNNGIREGTEVAINGITVELYQLAGPNDTVDLDTDTAITSTTTSGTGTYSFPNLDPGNYAVVIPANQFGSGAQLSGFANSTGNDPAPDPDDNVDNDDNGTVLISGNTNNGAVFSGTITLVSGSEPINDDDTDPNTNTTLDFGFFPQIDLVITKTLDQANSNLNAGGNAVFSFVVDNLGPRDATGVTVTDVFPVGLTPTGIQNASGNFTISTNGNTVTVTIGDVAVLNGTATFELTADIGANQFDDLTNPATVSGLEVDIDPTNNSDSAAIDLPQADLSIVKVDLTDPVNAGEQLTYQITVTNNGPDAAAGVSVTDPLPADVTFVSGNVGGNSNLVSFDSGTGIVTATVGALANQATSVITIVVTVNQDSPTPLTNNATVTSTPNTDPDPTNNSTSEDTTIDRLVDVAVVKTASGSVIAGEDTTYTVVVTNNGPSQASGIEVTDTLDANLTLVGGSFDPGTSGVTITTAGQDLTFDVGILNANESATFTFDVTIDSGATGTIPNTANVTTTDTDSNQANNTDSVSIVIDQAVDLILTKTVDQATAVPGQDQLVYTITIAHDADSPSDATGVVVTDTLPAGVSGVVIDAATADQTDFSNGVVTVQFNSLPVGETRTFTITVDVDPDATGTVTNPAAVAVSETELNNTNNSDDAATTLTPDFDVVVTKSVDDNTADPLQTITYTVGLQNEGPSTASGVILSDPIPTGLTFVSADLGGQAGTSDGTTVTFPAIDLAPNATATATLVFTVDASATGTITNTASVPDMSNGGENDTTNNSASVDLTVTELVDLNIDKIVNLANAQVGNTLIYTVTVNNNGPSLASGVSVTDTLPTGVTFVSGVGPNSEALAVVGGVVTVDGGDLANGGSFSFTINATVDAGAGSTLVNSSTVTTTTNETNLANNTDTASTNIDPMTASIAGSVYVDSNNNGIRDANETGIQNVLITLSGTDALGNPINATANTDASGDYLFANLAAGTYSVQESQPDGFFDGIDTSGTGASSTTGDDIFTQLGLGQAATAESFNFGERLTIDAFSKRRFLASS